MIYIEQVDAIPLYLGETSIKVFYQLSTEVKIIDTHQ